MKNENKTGSILWLMGILFTLGFLMGNVEFAKQFADSSDVTKLGFILLTTVFWPLLLGYFLAK